MDGFGLSNVCLKVPLIPESNSKARFVGELGQVSFTGFHRYFHLQVETEVEKIGDKLDTLSNKIGNVRGPGACTSQDFPDPPCLGCLACLAFLACLAKLLTAADCGTFIAISFTQELTNVDKLTTSLLKHVDGTEGVLELVFLSSEVHRQ